MNRQAIEAMAVDVIEKVRAGSFQEDAAVEIKSDWPDPQKAARRLAGHANSALGEPILWIIGLDQKSGECWLSGTDTADWWAQVKSQFQGAYPELTDIVLRTTTGDFELLWFETYDFPFVVKNAGYGSRDSGPIEREVPWRSGTAVRTSTREDLLRMLVPRMKLPDVEVLSASASLSRKEPGGDRFGQGNNPRFKAPYSRWSSTFTLYISPAENSICVLPVHRTTITLRIEGGARSPIAMESMRYSLPVRFGAGSVESDSRSIERTESEALIHLPGRLVLSGNQDTELVDVLANSAVELTFSIRPIGTDLPVRRAIRLSESGRKSINEVQWSCKADPESGPT